MNKDLSVSESIEINTTKDVLWDVLINPDKIKLYLYGTEAVSNWGVGDPILFQGSYEGTSYQDKGNVLQVMPGALFQYNYWSSFSPMEDKPENYCIVTYTIESISANKVLFRWTQEGFASTEGQAHAQAGMAGLLKQIKEIAEASYTI